MEIGFLILGVVERTDRGSRLSGVQAIGDRKFQRQLGPDLLCINSRIDRRGNHADAFRFELRKAALKVSQLLTADASPFTTIE